MGIGSFIKKNEKKGKGAKALRKRAKRKQRKAEQEKNIVIEDTELLSKEQLKKLAKQPTNNIRVSGKRRRKMLKRLRHSQKEKSQMDVEVASGSGASGSKVKDADMESDEEMSDDDEQTAEASEMT
ncbi:uncharacterized protein LOC123552009 [Mercenaria mercenaria]|uniref:uncharacterized protein LOC123552009 n=1 Tax=Mercenaria mercenaria TaxID=6596 RepID=UPI001E1DB6EA|nr:uncharacterized protein LOC123552009 [Mercenaria mercenaria]